MKNASKGLDWVLDLHLLSRAALTDQLEDALEAILRHIVDGFGAASGTLAVVDRSEQVEQMRIVAAIDLPPEVIGQTIRLGEGILGGVAATGQPMIINGARDAGRTNGVKRQRPTSAICWPLLIAKRLIGALSVNRFDDCAPFSEADLERGQAMVTLLALVLDNLQMQRDQQARIDALSRLNREMFDINAQLKAAQAQLLQSEKMASIGQLAAGVAHEINNPIGFVYSNLGTLDGYVKELLALARQAAVAAPVGAAADSDIEFLAEDIPALLRETREGLDRVKKIVQDLKDFSHADHAEEWEWCDVLKGLESTLNIVHNELKYKATVHRNFAPLPPVLCLPSQLNQVFMNLLVNAGQAIEAKGNIQIDTAHDGTHVWVDVRDDGCGIKPEVLGRIFEPFFTTKPVGKGTGLGLSVSYAIVKKHHGEIAVESEPGRGTRFRVRLPLDHRAQRAAAGE
jgi:signal transduction histidine kinase